MMPLHQYRVQLVYGALETELYWRANKSLEDAIESTYLPYFFIEHGK